MIVRSIIISLAALTLVGCAEKSPDEWKTELAKPDTELHSSSSLENGCQSSRQSMLLVGDSQSRDARLARRDGCITVAFVGDSVEVGEYHRVRGIGQNQDVIISYNPKSRAVTHTKSDGERSYSNTTVFASSNK